MNNKVKNILLKLNEAGFESYIVGGFVRDSILNISTDDVDIATTATPKEVIELFELSKKNDEYGSIYFKDNFYNYDITTFRNEIEYNNRRPIVYEYTRELEIDAKRRDFTINALYMDSEGKIIDFYDGISDISNKIIRVIGNINDKMTEDPLRILRAIRLASELDFTLEDSLFIFIKQNKQLLRTLSNTRKKEELDRIFKSKYKEKGIQLIKELKLTGELNIVFPEHLVITDNYMAIWSQIENNYQFNNKDMDIIKSVKKVLKYGIIDNIVLFEYGLYPCYLAGEILNVPKSYISDVYKSLTIYSIKDIDINGDEIIELLGISPSEKLSDIIFDLEINILNNVLINKKDNIKDYLLENWR